MKVYYNEIDDSCCDWLSNLMDAGAITGGVIDNRSIEDIRPSDLEGFDRVHFFAGIGVWEYAFIQSGLSAYSGIWTGSCPCQPFSAAGKGSGFDDERHLWPAFFHLIEERRPSAVLGEQVASKDGLTWLDLVSADLEGTDYAFGAGDICAAGFGAPHIRQRLYWAAFGLGDDDDARLEGHGRHGYGSSGWAIPPRSASTSSRDGALAISESVNGGAGLRDSREREVGRYLDSHGCATGGTSDDFSERRNGRPDAERPHGEDEAKRREGSRQLERNGELGRIPNSIDRAEQRSQPRAAKRLVPEGDGAVHPALGRTGPTNGFWRASDWLKCRDDKWRAVEPGTFPLAHGASSRVGRLRAYGNAVVAPQAIEFCRAIRQFIEVIDSDI